jgi:dihydropyrimidinase
MSDVPPRSPRDRDLLLIRGGTVVNADGQTRADVLIEGERIAAVGSNLEAGGAEIVDAGGALVIPGGIDVHTHFDLPVGEVRSADDFETGTLAAACGGTTCVIDFAGAGREDPRAALQEWHAKADGRATVDYGFHLTVTSVPGDPGVAEALFRSFVDTGVTSVKLYLAYPERLMVDDATLSRAFVAARAAGVLVCVHAEDGLEAIVLTEDVRSGGETGPPGLAAARPAEIEASAIRSAARLARDADASVYVVHLSSAAGVDAVLEARRAGADVLAETCPHYLFLTRDVLARRDEGQDFCCTPPLRTAADREALWAALASGALQAVSTDHCPFTRADRRAGVRARPEGWSDFTEIPGGLPGVETRVGLAYQGVVDGWFDLGRWVDLVAAAPARVFGLAERKGTIAPGMDADVVVFDPGASKRLDVASLHMASDHSPYADRTITGWPSRVFSRGRTVALDGEPAGDARGHGTYVPRAPRVPRV